MSKQKTLENYDKEVWFCKCGVRFLVPKGTTETYCPNCGGYCSEDFWNQNGDIVMEFFSQLHEKEDDEVSD